MLFRSAANKAPANLLAERVFVSNLHHLHTMLSRMDSKFTSASALRDTQQGRRSRLIHRYAQVTAALVLLLFSTGILVFRQIYLWDRPRNQARYNTTTVDNGASSLHNAVEIQRAVEFDHIPTRVHASDRLDGLFFGKDRKSTRLNSSHSGESRMPSSA